MKARIKGTLHDCYDEMNILSRDGVCGVCSYRSFIFKTIHRNSQITLADAISNVKHKIYNNMKLLHSLDLNHFAKSPPLYFNVRPRLR